MEREGERLQEMIHFREDLCAKFPATWKNIVENWKKPSPENRAWLMYSANYLFRCGKTHWAIDPVTLSSRVPQAGKTEVEDDFRLLNFVLLTHVHKDHLDLDLISRLKHLPIDWIVPGFILDQVKKTGISEKNIIIPKPDTPMELGDLTITPFRGMHWEEKSDSASPRKGVPSMGYLVEHNGHRWLFPGDTRTYNSSLFPKFQSVEILFAHLWLGRGGASLIKPPLIDEFCEFCLAFHPKRILLVHLEELGRSMEDYWDIHHAYLVAQAIHTKDPAVIVDIARIGDEIWMS